MRLKLTFNNLNACTLFKFLVDIYSYKVLARNKKKPFVYHLSHSSHISSRKLVEGPLIQFPALHPS